MKKHINKLAMILMLIAFTIAPRQHASAAVPILVIIKEASKKVIKAIDLKIQRLQNKTIWLQNAQKVVENTLSKFKLEEISNWTEKQKEQYKQYYDELKKVKSFISYYQRIREVTQKQIRLVSEYNRAWSMLRQDKHFSADEITYMGKVYSGILRESLQNVEQISLIVRSLSLQMSDAKRLELINDAADRVDINYDDLIRFNRQNTILSLQRAKSQQDVDVTKRMYGLK